MSALISGHLFAQTAVGFSKCANFAPFTVKILSTYLVAYFFPIPCCLPLLLNFELLAAGSSPTE